MVAVRIVATSDVPRLRHDVVAMLNRSDRGTGNEIGKNDFRTNADKQQAGRVFEEGASMNQTRNDFFIAG